MKKIMLFGIAIILVFLMIGYFMQKNEVESYTYSIDDYTDYIENNTFSYQVGKIDDYDMAIDVGEKLFVNHFGEEIIKERPFKAYYDELSKTWLILGSIKQIPFFNTSGGVACAIIDENGNVLAIWHGK